VLLVVVSLLLIQWIARGLGEEHRLMNGVGPSDLPLNSANVHAEYDMNKMTAQVMRDSLKRQIKQARDFEEVGNVEKALLVYRGIISRSSLTPSDDDVIRSLTADVCHQTGGILFQQGKFRDSIKLWELALHQYDQHPAAHINLAVVYGNISMIRYPDMRDVPDLESAKWHLDKAMRSRDITPPLMQKARALRKGLDQVFESGVQKLLPKKIKIVKIDRRPYGITIHPLSHRVTKVFNYGVTAGIEEGDWVVAVNCFRPARGKLGQYINKTKMPFELRLVPQEYADNMFKGGFKEEDNIGEGTRRWQGKGLFPDEGSQMPSDVEL